MKFWQGYCLVMAVKLGPLESRTNDAEHQPERNFFRKTAVYSPLDHKFNDRGS